MSSDVLSPALGRGGRLGALAVASCGVAVLAAVGVVAGIVLGENAAVLKIVGATAGGLVVLVLAVLRRDLFALLFLGTVVLVEEFPTTLVYDHRFDRSLTLVYGKSLGIPGLYGTDLLLILMLVLFVGPALARDRVIHGVREPLTKALIATFICILISVGLSFLDLNSVTEGAYGTRELGFTMKASVAGLVPYFQLKTWMYVYLSFMVWRTALREPEMLLRVLAFLFFAFAGVVAIGVYRYVFFRHKLSPLNPLYYDDNTIYFMTVMTCFFILAWGERIFSRRMMVVQAVLIGLSLAITVLSMRRANLLGLAICMAVVFVLIPPWLRGRILMAGLTAGLAGLILAFIMGWDIGALFGTHRSASTASEMRASGIYRAALFYNLLRGTHFTLFGYGVKPLWNEKLVMGDFQLNFENVHNIYYWFILRTGLAGLGSFLALLAIAFRTARQLVRTAARPGIKVLAETILVALILYVFVGSFHPVYAMSRFVITLGFLFALLLTLRETNDRVLLEGAPA